jgi:type II secretory pathway pseudopilin PulG
MKKWLKVLLVLAVIGIIAALYIYFFVYNKPHRDIEKAKPDFTMQAEMLYNEFTSQKDSANTKYLDKVLEINGNLKSVEKTDTLSIIVFSFNEGMFGDEGIRCTLLPKYREMASDLKPNDMVTIKGLCQGYNDTDVILEKCSITNP